MAQRAIGLGLLTMALGCRSLPNVTFPTLGGRQLWADEAVWPGWRIQRNLVTGHCRLLDDRDLRYAWGTYTACTATLRSLNGRQPSVQGQDVVILLPGIARSRHALGACVAPLEARGYTVLGINQPSLRWSLARQSRSLAAVLDRSIRGADRSASSVTVWEPWSSAICWAPDGRWQGSP